MKAVGYILAAVAAFLLLRGFTGAGTTSTYVAAPQKPQPQPWYNTLVNGVSTFLGTAVGSYTAQVPKTKSATPQSAPQGGVYYDPNTGSTVYQAPASGIVNALSF